ncbi:aspartate kinase [Marinicrinis lubricantis]|uniref:Aspartokinase n=1 Tax=Marinicrinis lubricantis TaxID=2086470 RepID=A0ABW1IMG3_9BACL
MRILVQKFGGTSLATGKARKQAVHHVKRALEEQYSVVVVVSAMGRKGDPYATDTLLELVQSHGSLLQSRETDLLLSCGELISAVAFCSMLKEEGIQSTVLTGPQAGIITNGDYGNAQIVSIQTSRMMKHLDEGKVVVVTGFQGKSVTDEITTLGRGGSDTSATAIGAALHAEFVDIFTDVEGILTADPKIVKDTSRLSAVSYMEICNMAYQGAKVIHPRAVEVAMQANIPVRVRSTFSEDEGTLVASPEHLQKKSIFVRDRYVTGIASVSHVTQLQIMSDEGQYDLQLKVFKAMAQNNISVDFINVNPSGVVYTVFDHQVYDALRVIDELGYHAIYTSNCAKISVIGGGMNGVPGIMASIVEALTEADIQILQSADSNTTIWVLVAGEHMEKAMQALHSKFNLHALSETAASREQ